MLVPGPTCLGVLWAGATEPDGNTSGALSVSQLSSLLGKPGILIGGLSQEGCVHRGVLIGGLCAQELIRMQKHRGHGTGALPEVLGGVLPWLLALAEQPHNTSAVRVSVPLPHWEAVLEQLQSHGVSLRVSGLWPRCCMSLRSQVAAQVALGECIPASWVRTLIAARDGAQAHTRRTGWPSRHDLHTQVVRGRAKKAAGGACTCL
ncbi:hypothetical protein CYMTET_23119 [Cymbomonas tetramitiformis]|uniref:Uncharacterized protein n=1 Tax=Cymbomonas tetramitiformis TaxID=36881 RepID=A0AAE0L198_9CHLO|nr:hypothetical protein CYMTET_23119 [Cymbomonas tetramitiformis]